jgi:hypothetical protein
LPGGEWSNRALLQAFLWMHESADFPAAIDKMRMRTRSTVSAETDFPAIVPTGPDKAL